MNCYFDGLPCDCDAHDVVGECPRDTYLHDEDDFVSEDMIDDAYELLKGMNRNDEDEIHRY